MKKLLTLATVFFISVQTFAQSDAKKLLDDVSAKLKTYKTLSLQFTYSINGKDTQGNLDLENSKYVVNFMGVTQIYDGKKTYVINPSDEEVTISSTQPNEALSVAKVLSFYTSGYSYKMDIKQKEAGKTIQYVKLTPTGKSSDVKEVLLGIDTATKMIYKKIDVMKNGSKTILTIKSFKTNPSFPKNHFTFTKSKYPNYYINNLD